MKFVITITRPAQTGMDTFINYSTSRVFSTDRPVSDWFKWSTNMGFKNTKINDFVISEYTGEST